MGASASADTSFFGVTSQSDSATATWKYFNPGSGDTIAWNSGPNKVNATVYPRIAPHLTEMKFFTPGATPAAAPAGPAAKAFIGFSRSNGNGGSIASSSGSGSSTSVAGAVTGTNWVASWTVTAAGVQRVQPPPAGSYESKADADDPVQIRRSDLAMAGVTGPRLSLYLPVGLSQMSHGSGGGGALSVGFKTSKGTVNLLKVGSASGGVSVASDAPSYLKIFRVQGPGDNPMAAGQAPLKLKDIQQEFSDLMKTGTLSAPFRLGILLENIAVPGTEIASGVLAEFHVSTSVIDAVAGGRGRRQKPRRQQPRKQKPRDRKLRKAAVKRSRRGKVRR